MQRANFPFRIDDTAIFWRQLGLGYFAHKRSFVEFDQTGREMSRKDVFDFCLSGLRSLPVRLNLVFAIIRTKPNRLVLQIVRGPDESHGSALGPHQD